MGELTHVQLAEHNGPGSFKVGYDSRIVFGYEIRANLGRVGSEHAFRVDLVLDGDGYSVEWASIIPASDSGHSLKSFLPAGHCHDCNIRVD